MAKKNNETHSIIDGLIAGIKSQITVNTSCIPNIIDFCYSPEYLNLKDNSTNPIDLYPLQEIALKSFYRGTIGNENLILTDTEIKLLQDNEMEYVIDKFNSGNLFRECVLAWGRRSGKDMITSFIAAYEAMRILEVPGGNPFAYYHIKEGNPIYILTVANSDPQAQILFNDIKSAILNSPYFQDKIGDEGKAIDSRSICLLTPHDKEANKERIKKGMEPTKGSIVILAGHSNSDSLRGKRTIALLLDEVAAYKSTSGSSSGETIVNSLIPSTNDFKIFYTENGIKKDRLDSKIVYISSPRGKDGVFWRTYQKAFDPELGVQTFVMRAPTWKVNLIHSKESCRRDFSSMPEQEFAMELGAEFAGLEGEKFISDEYVDKAISYDLVQKEVGVPGVFYYAHLDPASSSHNYALVIIHVEDYIKSIPVGDGDRVKRERRKKFIVDHIKVWSPSPGKMIDFNEVDNYVIMLSKRFRFAMISYDTYESISSMQKLRKNGIPVKITQFRKRYKVEIYRNLENLLITGDVLIPGQGPFAKLLELELKNLKRKWTPGGGFKIGPNEEGDVKTDDVIDALAGACGVAANAIISGYAKPETVYMPLSRDSTPTWRIGQGVYTNPMFQYYNSKFGIGGH